MNARQKAARDVWKLRKLGAAYGEDDCQTGWWLLHPKIFLAKTAAEALQLLEAQ